MWRSGEGYLVLPDGPSIERQRLLGLAHPLQDAADVVENVAQLAVRDGIVRIERDEHLADRQGFL